MKNQKLRRFFILILVGGFFILFNIQEVNAYGVDTHSYLTQEAVKFYNQHFPQNKISPDLLPYLIEGSRKEDNTPRWFNHFYDPIYNRGLSYDPAIDPLINISTWQKSKDWAQDSNNQNNLIYKAGATIASVLTAIQQKKIGAISAETDFTWQRAINFYLQGEEEKAMYAVGHILHLIQDKAVPDHTRNDPHPFDSPYEIFTDKYTLNSPDSDLLKRLQNKKPIILNDLSAYFDNLAKYSNNNFYSKDTIGIQSGYNIPQPSYFSLLEDGRIYGIKECREFSDYPLILAKGIIEISGERELINYPIILSSYWVRLSTYAVQYSAGVINLFFQETERLKNTSPVAQDKQTTGILASLISGVSSIFQSQKDFVVIDKAPIENNVTQDLLSTPQVSLLPLSIKPTIVKNCSFDINSLPQRNKIIINEIAWMGMLSGVNDEWIELKNISANVIDISGWQLLDKDEQIKITFLPGSKIPAGGFYLLERSDDTVVPAITADLIYSGTLSNTNEGLRLFDNNCNLQDEVSANPNWPAGDNVSKKTMERGSNLTWHTSAIVGGTPKRENTVPPPVINQQVSQTNQANQPNQPADSINQVQSPAANQNQAPNQTQNQNVVCTFATNQSALQQKILINEVAWMGTSASANDEWIELKNISSNTVDISGWQLLDKDEQIKIIFSIGTQLSPADFYLLERTDDESVLQISADKIYTGALENTNEGLRLFDNNCNLQDEVSANPNWPAGDNVSKKTMERGSNLTWHTSAIVGGTPKRENTVSTTSQNNENNNSSSEQENQEFREEPPQTINNQANNIVISEIMYGLSNCAKCEFIELYNPLNQDIDLRQLIGDNRLRIISSTGSITNRVINWKQTIIPSKGFFLFLSSDYNELLSQADATFSAYLSDESGVQLTVNNGAIIIDEVRWPKNQFKAGESWERKTRKNNVCISPQGEGEFLGNDCNTNNNLNDFELRLIPQPQNSFSLTEPRSLTYLIQDFNIDFNTEKMELIFNWQPIVVENNVKLTYELREYSSPAQTIFQADNIYEYRKKIEEVGRNYRFSLHVFDKSGKEIASAEKLYFAPSFLKSLYFYKNPRQVDEYLLSVYYNKYPFVPDLYQRPDSWRLLVFYLNSEAAEEREELLIRENYWQPIKRDKSLKLKYPRCSGLNHGSFSLILPDIAWRCQGGSLYQDGLHFDYLEDNHFLIKADYSPGEANFSENDYLTVAYYAFSFSGFGNQTFSLVAVDKNKYYFQKEPPPYFAPSPPSNIRFVFDEKKSELTTFWDMAKDQDSIDSHLNYEISYNGSPWELTHLSHTKLVEPQKNYQIKIRAVDNFDLRSDITTVDYYVQDFSSPFGLTNIKWGYLNSSSRVEIVFEFEKYPFIEQGWYPWSAIIFYFNQLPPDIYSHSFPIEALNEIIVRNNQQLILFYPQCSSLPSTAVALFLALEGRHCFRRYSLPPSTNQIILPESEGKGRVVIEVQGITNSDKNISQLTNKDYFTIAFFNSYPHSFSRVGVDTHRYYFQP